MRSSHAIMPIFKKPRAQATVTSIKQTEEHKKKK